MAEGKYDGLRYEHFVTNRAVLSFGKTGACARRCNRFVFNLGVTELINIRINVSISAMAGMGSLSTTSLGR